MKNLMYLVILISLTCLLGGCSCEPNPEIKLAQMRIDTCEKFYKEVSRLQYGSTFPKIPSGVYCSVKESNREFTKYRICWGYLEMDVCVRENKVISIWKNY
jgi:hypothetical protein